MNRFLCPVLLLAACSGHSVKTNYDTAFPNQTDTIGPKLVSTRYMPTGFYYLAEHGKGIEKWMNKTDSVFMIFPLPFASVVNIKKATLQKTESRYGDFTELCLVFDNKGTKDLAEGTGNALHPKIAVIVANKLLYVVDNTYSIKTGIMYIALKGYSEKEMKAMLAAVNNKK